MARNRTIDSDALLDAAERVAIRDGAVGLSIDAVAREAGISKSRVVYDYKSKSGLLRALVERRLRMEDERVLAAVKANGSAANPELSGRIAAAQDTPNEDDRAIALTLCAAMSSEVTIVYPPERSRFSRSKPSAPNAGWVSHQRRR